MKCQRTLGIGNGGSQYVTTAELQAFVEQLDGTVGSVLNQEKLKTFVKQKKAEKLAAQGVVDLMAKPASKKAIATLTALAASFEGTSFLKK